MPKINNKYFECPECGCSMSFKFNGEVYVSTCPYCKLKLIMEKEEFERKVEYIREVYFEEE